MRDVALQKKKKGVKEAGGGWVPALEWWKERHVLQAGTKRDSEDFGEYISEELTSPSDSHGGCGSSDNFLTLLGRASSQHRLDPYQRLELRRSPRHFSSCPLKELANFVFYTRDSPPHVTGVEYSTRGRTTEIHKTNTKTLSCTMWAYIFSDLSGSTQENTGTLTHLLYVGTCSPLHFPTSLLRSHLSKSW